MLDWFYLLCFARVAVCFRHAAAVVCNYENELNLNSLLFINRKGVHHSAGCRNRNTAEHQRV